MQGVVETNVGICEALGLNPNHVRSITIRMHPDHPPKVEVEYAAHYLLQHPEMVDAVSRFVLTPDPDAA